MKENQIKLLRVFRAHSLGLCFSGSNFSQGEGTNQLSGSSEDTQSVGMVPSGPSAPPVPPPGSPAAMGHSAGTPMPQSIAGQHPPPGFSMQPPIPSGQAPPFHGNRANINTQMNMQRPQFPPDLQMLQSHFPFPSMGQSPVELLSNFLQNHTMAQQGGQCLLTKYV